MTGIPDEVVEAWGRIKDQVRNTADNHGGYELANADIAALEAAGLPALLERVEAIECTCEAYGPEQHLVPCPRSSFGKVLEAFKREHRWRMEVTADRDTLAAKVARVERLLEHGAVQHVECGNHWVAATQLRAALDANDTGVTLTPANAAHANVAPPSTIPDDGDTP